jgi:hypothetical protein
MADYVVTLTGKDNLSNTIKTVKQELNSVGGATSKLDTIQKKFDTIQNSTAPLKKQLRDLKTIMADMNLNGLSNTEQFTQIAQYAGKLKDAMDDAGAATKRFADDTFALSATADAMQVVAGAGNVMVGALGAFGVESDKVQQAILKVQSAMAILNGVQGIANKLNKDSALMQAIKAIRLKATTAATNEATAAQIKNNLAVLANPYVAAAAALAALAAALIYYTGKTNEMTDAEKGAQEAMKATLDANKSGYEQYMKTKMELEQLKTTLDNFRGSKEQEKKLVQDLNSKYGKSLGQYKSINDWKKALSNTSLYYCRVMEAEAKLTAINTEAYKAYAQAMAGEDTSVNMEKFRKLKEEANKALDDLNFYKKELNRSIELAGGTFANSSSGGSSRTTRTTTKSTTTTNTSKKPDFETGSLAEYQARLKDINEQLNKRNLTRAEENKLLEEAADLENRIAIINKGRENIKSGALDKALKPSLVGITLKPQISNEDIQTAMQKLQADLDKIHPTVTIRTNLEKMQDGLEKGAFMLDKFSQSASSLASITDDEGIAVAGIIAKAIAQIALGAATATAQAAELGPWAWIAFGATAMAEMIAMISSIHSATGYATGGVVGGNSTNGDRLLIRVNSGEMILNKRQQTNLYNAIASGNIGGGGGTSTVSFRLRGSDIYGALKNYSAIKGKTGINTGIS